VERLATRLMGRVPRHGRCNMVHLFEVNNERQANALKERDRFLSSHPELKGLQRKIDERLKGASTGHNRLVLIHDLMMDSFLEMDRKLQVLLGGRRPLKPR
jgi:hypothetical protein